MRGRHVYRGGRFVGFFHPSTSNTQTQRAMVEAPHASIYDSQTPVSMAKMIMSRHVRAFVSSLCLSFFFCFFSFVFGIFRSSFVVVCGPSPERGWRYDAGGANVCWRGAGATSSWYSLCPSRALGIPARRCVCAVSSSGAHRCHVVVVMPRYRGDSVGFGVLSHTALLVPVPGPFPSHVPRNLPIHPGPGLSPSPHRIWTSRFLARPWLIAYVLPPACPAHIALLVSFPSTAHCPFPSLSTLLRPCPCAPPSHLVSSYLISYRSYLFRLSPLYSDLVSSRLVYIPRPDAAPRAPALCICIPSASAALSASIAAHAQEGSV
ncbi:hypothetical protein B0H14DRAFT_2829595 [Mycena olivaceomarginata]|nr:hypothetical protein B0H14DRAFT_2829595 [Mycena olivaceomarginata]